jgi:hypothetical protein
VQWSAGTGRLSGSRIGRAVGVVVDAAVAGFECDAEALFEDFLLWVEKGLGLIDRLVVQVGLQAVGDVDPGFFSFPRTTTST